MARTQDYFDYLVNNVDIAPTNSQEEVDAAQLIAKVFDAHGLEPTIQEFEASENSALFQGIAMAVLFLGLFLAGLGGAGLTAFGVLLAAGGAALLIMRYLGNDVLAPYGPVAKSQNVIAFHEATGEMAAKGNRPIVIVAHYDTPREDLFWIPALAPYQAVLKQACVVCVPLAAAMALFQILGFVPGVVRRVFWLIGLIAALPVLLWGITIIARRFMGFTPGSNNNKAAVAAMLGVLDRIRPAEDGVTETSRPRRTRETIAAAIARAKAENVRHGEGVLRELSILPEGTQVTYTDEIIVRDEPAPVQEEEYHDTYDDYVEEDHRGDVRAEGYDEQDMPAGETGEVISFVPREVETEEEPADEEPADETEEEAPQDEQLPLEYADEPAQEEEPQEAATGEETGSIEVEEEEHGGFELVSDESAQDFEASTKNEAEEEAQPEPEAEAPAEEEPEAEAQPEEEQEFDPDATQMASPLIFSTDDADATQAVVAPAAEEEEKPAEDPPTSRFVNRAPLFDLPDPAVNPQDPLASTAPAQPVENSSDHTTVMPAQRNVSHTVRIDTTHETVQQDEITHITPEDLDFSQNRKRRGLFGRRRKTEETSMSEWLGVDADYNAKTDGRKIGSWEHFHDADEDGDDKKDGNGSWKGGATENGRFRVIDGDNNNEEPAADEEFELEFIGNEEEAETPEAPVFDLPRNPFANDEAPEDAAEEAEPVEAADEAPTDDELREAVLSMDDNLLISHDIWFVAAGASDLDHAGIKAFLSEYRRSCRGAFLINLDCIGSGDLTVLTEEGLENRRRADRRLVRMLADTANDIHVPLNQATMPWGDTDATPAMRTSMRSATITGLDENGLPSRAHAADDEPEYVDDQQVEDVCTLVTELIRRS